MKPQILARLESLFLKPKSACEYWGAYCAFIGLVIAHFGHIMIALPVFGLGFYLLALVAMDDSFKYYWYVCFFMFAIMFIIDTNLRVMGLSYICFALSVRYAHRDKPKWMMQMISTKR